MSGKYWYNFKVIQSLVQEWPSSSSRAFGWDRNWLISRSNDLFPVQGQGLDPHTLGWGNGLGSEWPEALPFIHCCMQSKDPSCSTTMRLNLRPSAIIGCSFPDLLPIQPITSDQAPHCTVRTRLLSDLIICKWRLQVANSLVLGLQPGSTLTICSFSRPQREEKDRPTFCCCFQSHLLLNQGSDLHLVKTGWVTKKCFQIPINTKSVHYVETPPWIYQSQRKN